MFEDITPPQEKVLNWLLGLRQAGARHVLADFSEPRRLLQCLNDALIPVEENLV
ncbi:MAG TPA: hypothetical protein VGC89_10560 [Pyrinomonadaceae bacterium]|jgi:hypothetical protein